MTTLRPHLTQLPITCALVLAAGMLLQGCSFIFVDTPPPRYAEAPPAPSEPIACTSSVAAPVVDTVIGAFEVIRTGFALSASDSAYTNYPISRGADIGFGMAFASLFAASAIYGYINTSRCADLKENTPRAAPPEYIPPPPRLPPLHAMCGYDAQCKGDRICEGGRCVSPPARRAPVPAPPPAEPKPEPSGPQAPAPSLAPGSQEI
jgi:hypothetical protein